MWANPQNIKEVNSVFEGKLFVAFGERDGVPGPLMTETSSRRPGWRSFTR